MHGYPNLFAPLAIGRIRLRNRVAVTAHLSNFSDEAGRASQTHRHYYRERADGGAALLISEGLAVHASALSQPFHARLDHDEAAAAWQPVLADVHARGAAMFAQLNHVGRFASPFRARPSLWSASAAPFLAGDVPHALRAAEIPSAVEAFAAAAVRAERAGFDGVELHAGHGYLLSQFLSPSLNFRSDAYGGSFENRLRLPLEVLGAIRRAVSGSFVCGVRISADEFVAGGIDLPLAIRIVGEICARGLVDYVSVTEGNQLSAEVTVPDMEFARGAFRHLARGIRSGVHGVPPVFSVGRITTPELAEEILAAGDADVVGMTRAHIADPFLLRKTAQGRRDEIRLCIGCNQGCIGSIGAGAPLGCLQNPAAGSEAAFGGEWPARAARSRRVVVVGGGPAGMEAAWVAAARGHRVSLIEAAAGLGGQVELFRAVGSRAEFAHVVDFRRRMLGKFGVEVRTGCRADAARIAELSADHVLLATGCRPFVPEGFGSDGRAITPFEALSRAPARTERVLVCDVEGNAQAITVAEHLAQVGCEVTIAVGGDGVAAGMPRYSRVTALKRMARLGVRMLSQLRFAGWEGERALLCDVWSGEVRALPIDRLVAVGYRLPDDALLEPLEASGVSVSAIGDAFAPRQAQDAIRDGHRAAHTIE